MASSYACDVAAIDSDKHNRTTRCVIGIIDVDGSASNGNDRAPITDCSRFVPSVSPGGRANGNTEAGKVEARSSESLLYAGSKGTEIAEPRYHLGRSTEAVGN